MKIERILVPVDFSDSAGVAVDHAIEFAQKFDAKIDLLHSYQLNTGGVVLYETAIPVNLYENLRAIAREEIGKVHEKVRAAGVKVSTHLSQDSPSHAIVQAAEDLECDLIIMGTRGLTGLKHVLLGSVAERTVRNAPCPVLTIGDKR